MAINIGPKIGIDGEKKFRDEINNIVQQCKTLDSEMKNLTSSFDENDTSQEKLSQQSRLLTEQIEAQTKRIELLQKGLQESANKFGEADTRTLKWKQAVQDATTTLNRMSKQLDDVNSAMETNAYDQLTRDIERQEEEVKRLRKEYQNAVLEFGDASKEAEKLGQELSQTSSELKNSRSAMKKAADAADELDNSLEDAGDSAGELKGGFASLGDIVGGNIIADGIQSVVSGIKDLHEATVEYRTIMASLEASSEQAGYTAKQTAESYDMLVGVLGDTQTAATTLQNLQALNLEQEDLNELITDSIGAWARYGDSIPIDSLAESITETAKTKTVTGTFADVLNWATGEEDAFNAELQNTQTEADAARLVLDKLNELDLTQLGEDWMENNESLMEYNQSQQDLQEAMAELGETVEPLLTVLAEGLTGILDLVNTVFGAFEDYFDWYDELIGAKTGDPTGQVKVFRGVQEEFAAMTSEQQMLVEALVQSGYEWETSVYNVSMGVTSLKDALNGQVEGLDVATAKYIQHKASVEQTAAAVNEQALAYDNLSIKSQEDAVYIVQAMMDIQNAVANAANTQLNLFGAIAEDAQITSDTVLQSMQTQVSSFNNWGENLAALAESTKTTTNGMEVTINEGLLQYLAQMGPEGAEYIAAFNQMTGNELAEANTLWSESVDFQTLSTSWGEDLKTAVGTLAAGSEQDFKDLASKMHVYTDEAGNYTGQGYIDAVKKITGDATTATEEFGNANIDALKAALGVASPSWKAEEAGIYVGQGLIDGLDSETDAVRAAAQELADQSLAPLNGMYGDYWDAGYYAAEGLANGIQGGEWMAINAAAEMAAAAAAAARRELDINSPSGVFEEIGEYSAAGYEKGFNMDGLKKQITDMLDFQSRNVGAILSYQNQTAPAAQMAAAQAGNTEIQIVVNAAEGQSEQAIADAVMYRLQHEVRQKKAVWG